MLPDGLDAARSLGLEPAAIESFPIRGIRFIGRNAAVESDFPHGPGYGVRRTVLHRALFGIAESAGVKLQWGRVISDVRNVEARWIVGADGASSRVRATIGLDPAVGEARRFGFRLHYKIAPWSEYVEIYWGAGCQIYVTPVGRGEVGVALLSPNSKLRVAEALGQFPGLAARLAAANTKFSATRGRGNGDAAFSQGDVRTSRVGRGCFWFGGRHYRRGALPGVSSCTGFGGLFGTRGSFAL